MPVGLTDADDADDAIYHGDAFYCATEHISVTILEPMSKSHMASEGDPQVALAASQNSTHLLNPSFKLLRYILSWALRLCAGHE
jgi:hypothetical protein